MLNSGLAKLLGFSRDVSETGKEYTTDKTHRLAVYREIRSLKFEELSDIDILHAVPGRLHSLAFTGDKWLAFADPVQQTGWLIDLKVASPYFVTGKEHQLQKV